MQTNPLCGHPAVVLTCTKGLLPAPLMVVKRLPLVAPKPDGVLQNGGVGWVDVHRYCPPAIFAVSGTDSAVAPAVQLAA